MTSYLFAWALLGASTVTLYLFALALAGKAGARRSNPRPDPDPLLLPRDPATEQRAIEERELVHLATRLGLRDLAHHFAKGTVEGVQVTVELEVDGLVMTARAEGIPSELTCHRIDLRPEAAEAGPGAFGRRLAVEGLDETTRAALLSSEMEKEIGRVVLLEDGEVRQGAVTVRLPQGVLSDARIDTAASRCLGLAQRLATPLPVLPGLLGNATQDPDLQVRLRCLDLLAERFPQEDATRRACEIAIASPFAEERLAGARRLGEAGVEVLKSLVEDPRLQARLRIRALTLAAPRLERFVVQRLVDQLLEAEWLDPKELLSVLRAAREAGYLPVARISALIDGGDAVRLGMIARALASADDPAAEPLLLRLAEQADREIAEVALAGLASSGTLASVEKLLALAESHRSLREAARAAVHAIQARAPGAEPGQLSMSTAKDERGALSVPGEAGELAMAEPAAPKAARKEKAG